MDIAKILILAALISRPKYSICLSAQIRNALYSPQVFLKHHNAAICRNVYTGLTGFDQTESRLCSLFPTLTHFLLNQV